MKRIETLVEDIYRVLDEGVEIPDELATEFGTELARLISERLHPSERSRKRSLRMSSMGISCLRRLWLEINRPETIEQLPPNVRMKFLYGDLIESLVLFLAKLAGHSVEGQQDELEINGILGHRDAVIDGVTSDVKSASSYSFEKFRRGLTPAQDGFGYLDQIGGYLYAGQEDPKVLDKKRSAFVAVDKTLGHLVVDVHRKTDKDYSAHVEHLKTVMDYDDIPPRHYSDKPDGASGNRALGIECSYCPVRRACWPGLRGFAYSNGVRYLTTVVRTPDVPEVKV